MFSKIVIIGGGYKKMRDKPCSPEAYNKEWGTGHKQLKYKAIFIIIDAKCKAVSEPWEKEKEWHRIHVII